MISSENKSVAKSIRITPSAFSFIMSQKGDGFNEKFLNILYWAFWHEKDVAERVKILEDRERRLREQIDTERKLLNDLTGLHSGVANVCVGIKNVIDRCSELLGDNERYAAG